MNDLKKFNTRKSTCPFCGLMSADSVIVTSTTYNGDVGKETSDEYRRRVQEAGNSSVRFSINAPLWVSYIMLCRGCGSCYIDEDRSSKASVSSYYPDD